MASAFPLVADGQPTLSEMIVRNDDSVKISDDEFARAAAMAYKLSGIVIKDHKREMMQSRLARRLRALKIDGYSAYLDYVDDEKGRDEIGEFVNVVTTNLTSFFREKHHFEHLRDAILNPMVASGASRIRIWSAACSSGEEPYSIAMTVKNSKAANMHDLRILATDLDTNMLSRAREGVYPTERLAQAPRGMVSAATVTKGDKVTFRPEIRSMITFNQLNLLHNWPMRGPFDVVFCRNVLIYFDLDVKRRIIDRIARLIRPGGALYLGHSESLLGSHPHLCSEGRTIYRGRS